MFLLLRGSGGIIPPDEVRGSAPKNQRAFSKNPLNCRADEPAGIHGIHGVAYAGAVPCGVNVPWPPFQFRKKRPVGNSAYGCDNSPGGKQKEPSSMTCFHTIGSNAEQRAVRIETHIKPDESVKEAGTETADCPLSHVVHFDQRYLFSGFRQQTGGFHADIPSADDDNAFRPGKMSLKHVHTLYDGHG